MAPPPPPLDPALAGEDKGPTITGVSSAVVALSTLFVIARLWVRVRIMRKFELDDWLIVISTVSKTISRSFRAEYLRKPKICAWISVGFDVAAVKSGSGRHIQTLTTDELQGAILLTFLGLVSGILSFCVPKLAIVKLLSTLLNPSRLHLIWLWSISIFNLLILLGCLGMVFGQCYPSKSQWDFSVVAEYCWDKQYTVVYTQAVSDLYLSVYPAVVLYKIHLPTKKKVALSAALGIGSISTVVAADLKYLVSQRLIRTDDGSNLSIFTLLGPSQRAYPASDRRKGNDDEAVVVPKPAGTPNRTLNENEAALGTVNAKPQNDDSSAPPKTYQGIYRTDDIDISYAREETGNPKSRYHHGDWA
ncbi:putative integral membrane protein [Eutypa lata UCREL1]|uniref:Putative integral membrane protein n=1 Tax=Eutypa lata (strain UCR-EL1) TaxID=1287681 RepID=M7SS65_EUTLA|nr:putative integral membrane protein [Eutypa lata UCREL1]